MWRRRSWLLLAPRRAISIGGWCGPALILGKLGIRSESYPFDFSRVTLDGVHQFVESGFGEGFFPPGSRPYRPECVGIWVLFRGRHTAFAHFDLNDPKILEAFERKFQRWDEALHGSTPVTFFRTVSAADPKDEVDAMPGLEEALSRKHPQLDFRIALCVHDQGFAEPCVRLNNLSPRTQVYCIGYTEDESHTLFDRSQSGYAEIVARVLNDDSWRSTDGDVAVDPKLFGWRRHNNIALIDGVASVGGTCVGFGSKKCSDSGVCPFCGKGDWHKAGKPFRSNRPFTDEEDEVLLVHLYRILTGADKVAAVEQVAHEMNRGAFEVICRLQFLTNNSTKITDGLTPDE